MNHKLRIACTKESLKEIRRFVTKTLTDLHLPEIEVNMLVLAVDEICANRIIHSNNCDENLHLNLLISETCDGLTFEISDQGAPFDHTQYSEPDINQLVKEKKKGGLGLMLVNRIMDSIEVFKEKDLTVYRLFKKLTIC